MARAVCDWSPQMRQHWALEGPWAASSWVAELPAERALGSGGGRPYHPDQEDAIEEYDALLDVEGRGAYREDLNHQT